MYEQFDRLLHHPMAAGAIAGGMNTVSIYLRNQLFVLAGQVVLKTSCDPDSELPTRRIEIKITNAGTAAHVWKAHFLARSS